MEEESRVCSNCKHSIKAATFELHESHCVRHIKLCHVCDEPIPIKEMEDHFKENHAPTPCDLCGSLIAPDQLEEHQEQSCLEAKVECKFCELDIRRGSYPEHVEQCGSRTDYCELCNQRVMLKDMNEHKEMKCGHIRSESPLQRSDLRGMGLLDESSESESDGEYYPPHSQDNEAPSPPPPYEHSYDDSMQVDPYWLQTVAEACGEDNLDALLAQNVFFENMRSARSGDHNMTTTQSLEHHMTTEGSHANEGAAEDRMRDERTMSNPELDNRLLDEVEEKELSRMVGFQEDDDYSLAQRMQEREVMGHSRTLYDEQVARDMDRQTETEEASLPQHQPHEEGEESVSSKMLLEGEEEEEEGEGNEVLKKRLQETRDEAEKLVKRIEELDEESKSLKLVIELQKKDVAATHQAMWKKSSRVTNRSHSTSTEDSQFAHDYGGEVDDEQPRPKTPPPSSDCVPCQWCNKLIPFEQVMLHQQSCYDDYYKDGGSHDSKRRGYAHGPRFTDDTFRRVENEEENSQIENIDVECQYCHTKISIGNLATHEALCDSNPDIDLKRVYERRYSSSATLAPKVGLSPFTSSSVDIAPATKLLSVEKGPCEYCNTLIPLSELIKHEATCVFSHHKYVPTPPPSSPTLSHERTVADGTTSAAGTRRSLAIKFPATVVESTANTDSDAQSSPCLCSDQQATVSSLGLESSSIPHSDLQSYGTSEAVGIAGQTLLPHDYENRQSVGHVNSSVPESSPNWGREESMSSRQTSAEAKTTIQSSSSSDSFDRHGHKRGNPTARHNLNSKPNSRTKPVSSATKSLDSLALKSSDRVQSTSLSIRSAEKTQVKGQRSVKSSEPMRAKVEPTKTQRGELKSASYRRSQSTSTHTGTKSLQAAGATGSSKPLRQATAKSVHTDARSTDGHPSSKPVRQRAKSREIHKPWNSEC